MSKIDHSLFTAHEHALEAALGSCPECDAKLTIKRGKGRAFIGCTQYPDCHYTKPLHETDIDEVKRIDGSHCPECGSVMAVKRGRYGLFIGCSNFPECHHIESVKQEEQTSVSCPECKSGALIKRVNKYGKHFYACNTFPSCKYAVNNEPVVTPCPSCDWPIMTLRRIAGKRYLVCPQRQCGAKVSQDQ